MVEFIKPYPVIFEPTSEGFSVYSPVLNGCVSYGKDIEEGLANIKEAVTLHISSMIDDGEVVPQFDILQIQKENAQGILMMVEPDRLQPSKLLKGRAVRINITIDEYLLELTDKRAKELHINRSALIESGLRAVTL